MNLKRTLTRSLLTGAAVTGLVSAGLSAPAHAVPAPDSVLLIGNEIDFGSGVLVELPPPSTFDFPSNPGTLTWDTAGATITPRLTGKLWLKNALGMTVRMQLRYYNVFGTELTTPKYGGQVSTTSNVLKSWTVGAAAGGLAPYSNPDIYRVNVATTYLAGGVWYTMSSMDAFI